MITDVTNELSAIAGNELYMQALKGHFAKFVEEPTVTNESNELLGAKFRAYEQAKNMIEAAFKDLKQYKQRTKNSQSLNKGL